MSAHHEWLNLVEVSGPFLAVPVLREAFPQGLEALEAAQAKRLHCAYEEWRDAVDSDDVDLDRLHVAWIDEVVRTALEADDAMLRRGEHVPPSACADLPEHDTSIIPDLVLVDPTRSDALLLLVHVFPPDTNLSSPLRFGGLASSPADRMALHLRSVGCPLGIVTNGERWMLVHAPVGQVASFASWYARLWGQEPETLRAFGSLLGVRRFFAPEQDRLPRLFERSLKHQDEVTEALGEQVRRAVEVLVQALDRADQDRNRELLHDVQPQVLYEAGLTVMMRLVFLLAAEERGLLFLGEPRYDAFYAVSTLRMQLRDERDEILERRKSAWSRLLAVFRAIYGGIDHPTLRLPGMGGSLFDPDRFPFLEGRLAGTTWRRHPAEPLPIDDRTVLLLLDAIQLFEGRTLSYRALDVEQIGYVYEGLLERTVQRVGDVTLELVAGSLAKDPRVSLGELESARLDGQDAVVALLVDRSKRSESAVRNALAQVADARQAARLLAACRGDVELRDRLQDCMGLLRTDPWGYPVVNAKGSFVVVLGADRRETGTHYTPKSLTKRIVEETLTPLVYQGPAEGSPRDQWILKAPEAILDLRVCDSAMGSGAFLVQACRFLAERLVEAWAIAEGNGLAIDRLGHQQDPGASYEPLPREVEERVELASRLVVERCLYGVDLNPLAVELAKLSLWLSTLAKGRPFGFLDHNLKSGDALLGIERLEQLTRLSMAPLNSEQLPLIGRTIEGAVQFAIDRRIQLRAFPILDIRDVEAMAALDQEAQSALEISSCVADALIGSVYAAESATDLTARLSALAIEADHVIQGSSWSRNALEAQARSDLVKYSIDGDCRRPFHWPLEFPEVFLRDERGFDAFIGNPPFLGNRLWRGTNGPGLGRIVSMVLQVPPGKIDLCVAFHRRAAALLRPGGSYGLLATTNIAEGSALSVGLAKIVEHGEIYSACKGMRWPGAASAVVAIVCFRKGPWVGPRNCEGHPCEKIGPRLEPEFTDGWEPKALPCSMTAFEGVNNSKGMAFVITSEHPWFGRLRDEENSLLRPYITGDDITSSALTKVNRWALDIGERSLNQIAASWPVAHQFLIEVVHPTRTVEALKPYKGLHERWWQFWNHRAEQVASLRRKEDFIAFPKAPKYPICVLAHSEWIYTNKVIQVKPERNDHHAICLSSLFRLWIRRYSVKSLGGDNNTLGLSITKAVATFPLPEGDGPSTSIEAAFRFQEALTAWSSAKDAGMTDAMNAVHSPESIDEAIKLMRDCLEQVDAGVAQAYGWSDLDLSHKFRVEEDNERGEVVRYGLDAEVERECLHRLIRLNRLQWEASEPVAAAQVVSAASSVCDPSSGQTSLALGLPAPEPIAVPAKSLAGDPAVLVARFLRSRGGFCGKKEIISATQLSDGQWNAAIKQLVANRKVAKQGDKRSAKYKIVNTSDSTL
jgi:hypothetical protein